MNNFLIKKKLYKFSLISNEMVLYQILIFKFQGCHKKKPMNYTIICVQLSQTLFE